MNKPVQLFEKRFFKGLGFCWLLCETTGVSIVYLSFVRKSMALSEQMVGFMFSTKMGVAYLSAIDKILNILKEKGISQAFVCGKLGLRRSYLADVRIGKDNLSDDRLAVIADILNTTPEYLKGETDIKEKPATEVGSERNKELLELLEQLSEDQRQMLIRQIKGILSDE